MLLLGWVQLATTDQTKLEPFVPGRCFFGSSQCPGHVPVQALSLPIADTSTGLGTARSVLSGAWHCWALLGTAREGRGSCCYRCCHPSSSREAVWWLWEW